MISPIEQAASKALQKQIKRREIKTWQNKLYWIESGGNIFGDYLVELDESNQVNILIANEYAIGNAVHEYGGGDFTIQNNGDIFFVRQVDQNIYHWDRASKLITQISTDNQKCRYADLDVRFNQLLAVKEIHENKHVVNCVVCIDLDTKQEKIVAEGHDFYACPRFSPDGKKWAYLYWDHPFMPWQQCMLCYCEWQSQKNIKILNQSNKEVISQYCWYGDQEIIFSSDRTGWANIYHGNKALFSADMHFGYERWQQGGQNLAITDGGSIVAIAGPPEKRVLGCIKDGFWVPFSLPACDFSPYIAVTEDYIIVQACFDNQPPKILKIHVQSGEWQVLLADANFNDSQQNAVIRPQSICFKTLDNASAYGFFYAAKKKNESLPPLLVLCHGGPTAATSPQWDPMVQFWAQQGISVVDVNYRGSTGYGRQYQDALEHKWGVLDVEDCVAARDYLVNTGQVDPKRCFIRGKSSGGLTTLLALMWADRFAAGGCYYGVSDLMTLVSTTHKFEQYYLDFLIGPYPEEKNRYFSRSPLKNAKKIKAPVIFFHGLLDKVVPISQTELIMKALKEQNISCEAHFFDNEKHGFKDIKNKIKALVCEYNFFISN